MRVLILVALGCAPLISEPANPDGALQAIALSAHNSNKHRREILDLNLRNRHTDGRYKQVTRYRSKDGLQSSTLEDSIECECAVVGATPLSLRVVSESEVFVECAGPDGPEYVRTGHFTQDSENRLCLVGKEGVFIVDEHQDIIHVERSPAIRNGCVWHFVNGEEVLAGRLRARQNSNRKKRALPGNTWHLHDPVEPHDPYYIAGGQISRGGQTTIDIAQQAEELRIRESEITALLMPLG